MSDTDRYILEDKQPVPCPDLLTWGRWFGDADRQVARKEQDGVVVSTVFLGLDHSYGGGPPLLFETIVFNSDGEDQDCERCSTWEEAEAQHAAMCEKTFI